MHYVVAGHGVVAPHFDLPGVAMIADGACLAFEGPWAFNKTSLARVEDTALDDLAAAVAAQAAAGELTSAYAVEGIDEPGAGQAFAVAAHKMLDAERFRPYADSVVEVVQAAGGRNIARGGKVTPLAGSFVPDRAVIIEFPSAQALVTFYTSDVYAPLLRLRLSTTDPRFVMLARSGDFAPDVRRAAEAYVAEHPTVR